MRADVDLIRAAGRVNRAKLLIADQVDGIADSRVVGDTTLELGSVRSTENFPQQVYRGAGDVVAVARQIFAGHFRDHGDDGGIYAADADEAADRRPHFGPPHLLVSQQANPRERSPHQNHTSERCHGALILSILVTMHYADGGWRNG